MIPNPCVPGAKLIDRTLDHRVWIPFYATWLTIEFGFLCTHISLHLILCSRSLANVHHAISVNTGVDRTVSRRTIVRRRKSSFLVMRGFSGILYIAEATSYGQLGNSVSTVYFPKISPHCIALHCIALHSIPFK